MEIALCVHEVRRQNMQLALAERQDTARVLNADDAVLGFADFGEVRHKALPYTGDDQ